jgi:pyruvate/2-oxoglutarate dehydrogenase complex dihydrolipoamide dehydrogenase (E3) component
VIKEKKMVDVIVLGGGPAGVTAALRARELGARVTLIERGAMGGTCTNDGCVPTRVLAKAARLARDARQFEAYGLTPCRPEIDFRRLLDRAQEIVYSVHEKKQLLSNLDATGVHTIAECWGSRFINSHTVELADGTHLNADAFILCVGGHARRLPIPGTNLALTHSDVWTLQQLPRSAAIVGAAATGCQLATILGTFGTEVYLLDLAPQILPAEDAMTAAHIRAAFDQRGVHVLTGIDGITAIDRHDGELRLHYGAGGEDRVLSVEAVIQAVGWPGNIDPLNLEVAGVESSRSYVTVNEHLQTSAPHIYAAGDITGRMMLVQSAGYEARIAAENAVLGHRQTYAHQIVPHGGFTDPEYGSVGLTEEAAAQDNSIVVAQVPYADLDRAVIDDRTEGVCKLIADRESGRLLGAHVVGEQALEIVHMAAAGMASRMTAKELATLEIAYPTYAAVLGLAARRIAAKVGQMQLDPEWRALTTVQAQPLASEWESRA